MSCNGLNTLNPICQIGNIGSHVASDAFSGMAGWFAQAASTAANGLWAQIGSATIVNLDSPHLSTDLVATSAIAVVLCLGLFVIQVITSVLRREPGGLARATTGLLTALVASVFALAVTKALLAAVDLLSDGVVAHTMHTNMQGLGDQLALTNIATSSNNPAIVLLLSIVVLVAVVVVWAAMMIRKMMIIITAVMTPLAFSGATADITRGWVRKWVEFMAAMIASKLLLVIIFMIGVSVLEGAGQERGAGPGQDLTQLIIGALILLMGGFAPWIAIRMFHFAGDTLHSAHTTVAQGSSGARAAIAAPQKANAMHSQAYWTMAKYGNRSSGAASGGVSHRSATTAPQPGRGGAIQTTPGVGSSAGSPAGGTTGTGGAAAGPAANSAAGGSAAAGASAAAVAAPVLVAGATVQAAKSAGQAAGNAAQQANPPQSGRPPTGPPPKSS
jgi:hypothetical protein